MEKRLYIRNIHDVVDADRLIELFSSVGDVVAATVEIKLIRETNYRVGYVEMATEQQAADGIQRFHGQKIEGQNIVVTEDKPHVPGPAPLVKTRPKHVVVPKKKPYKVPVKKLAIS